MRKELKKMSCELINGDCLHVLKNMPNNSVDMVITSPPYFNLRDYGNAGEIGAEKNYKEYIENLIEIFDEVYRVLKNTGSFWLNIDDVYENQTLLGIPDRLKVQMIDNGWICRNEIIWHKPNAMPSSAKTRFNNDFEKMYFFTKTNNYYLQTQYEPLKSSCVKKAQVEKNQTNSKYKNLKHEASVRQGMNKARGQKLVYLRKNLPSKIWVYESEGEK